MWFVDCMIEEKVEKCREKNAAGTQICLPVYRQQTEDVP